MCCHGQSLVNLAPTSSVKSVHLPDGSVRQARLSGSVDFSDRIILIDVLYKHAFKFNLISVKKLSTNAHIKFEFSPTYCVLQDLKSGEVLTIGRVEDVVYILDKNSFDKDKHYSIYSF